MAFMTKIDNTQDVRLAMEVGDHDFEVEKQSLVTVNGIGIPSHVAIVDPLRSKYLGTVGVGWEPVQPKVIYELAEELIASTNGTINGVFNMWNGSVIGISFKLAERQYIGDDNVDLNFIMMTSFNGLYGIAGHATTYRVISDTHCNTSAKVYNLKHTKNVSNRIEVVKNMLRYYNNEIARFDEKMTTLVEHRMNDNAAVEWFKSLFPRPKSERATNILNNQKAVFINCLKNGKGSDILGVRGTCYGAFQALTEYVNYYRSVKIHNGREEEEVRFQSINFGSGNAIIQSGLNSVTGVFTEFAVEEFAIE